MTLTVRQQMPPDPHQRGKQLTPASQSRRGNQQAPAGQSRRGKQQLPGSQSQHGRSSGPIGSRISVRCGSQPITTRPIATGQQEAGPPHPANRKRGRTVPPNPAVGYIIPPLATSPHHLTKCCSSTRNVVISNFLVDHPLRDKREY